MKKRTTLIVLAVLVGAFALLMWMTVSSQAEDTKLIPPVANMQPQEVVPPVVDPEPAVVDGRADARHERLRAYTLEVMNGWTHAVPQMPVADYGDVASDIAMAVMMEPENGQNCTPMSSTDGFKRCLWGVPSWNSDHAKTVLLAALGYWEGARYAAYVDEGKCNDKAWRADPANAAMIHLGGNCDNGHAHSLWQIHPIMDESSPLYALCNAGVIDGSRLGAARCALELASRSMKSNGTLSAYTGEWWGGHPKADLRLDFAQLALGKHPLTLPKE